MHTPRVLAVRMAALVACDPSHPGFSPPPPARPPTRARAQVVVVFTIAFENAVEQAIAKVFLQEIEVTRRAARELATAPSVNFTTEPPHELKTITSLTPKTGQHFIGDGRPPAPPFPLPLPAPRPSPFPSPRPPGVRARLLRC